MPEFVIITPAHNEEEFIERTIQSVVAQTVLPLRWVVVDDASTDNTSKIIKHYQTTNSFIHLISRERPAGRHFGNKVKAFNDGLMQVRHLGYEFIGNLDADISLEQDYFEKLLLEFDRDPKLGIAGGMISSLIGGKFISQEVSLDSVAGAVQLFRRPCFEQIGGYMALPQGGIDAAAEIMARMMGWKVRTIPWLRALEYRRTGSATAGSLAIRLKEGKRLHSMGYSLIFFCMRCLYRSMEPPRIVGSVAALLGYLAAVLERDPIVLPREAVDYLRAEQRGKLIRAMRGPHL